MAEASTVVYRRASITIARTLQRQGNRKLSDLSILRSWLIKHLGVAYRGYLELDPVTLESSAKIAVTACRELEKFRAVLDQKLSEEKFVLVEKLLNQMLLVADAECADYFAYGFSAGLLLAQEARELVERQIGGK